MEGNAAAGWYLVVGLDEAAAEAGAELVAEAVRDLRVLNLAVVVVHPSAAAPHPGFHSPPLSLSTLSSPLCFAVELSRVFSRAPTCDNLSAWALYVIFGPTVSLMVVGMPRFRSPLD